MITPEPLKGKIQCHNGYDFLSEHDIQCSGEFFVKQDVRSAVKWLKEQINRMENECSEERRSASDIRLAQHWGHSDVHYAVLKLIDEAFPDIFKRNVCKHLHTTLTKSIAFCTDCDCIVARKDD